MSNARDTAKNLKTGLNVAANGDIIDLQKDGTTVGSIGTNSFSQFELSSSAALTLEQNSTTTKNLYFSDTTLSTFDGSQSGTVDLGRNVATWKDLYLSGGAYLGGTTSANLLNDYETGNFTMTMSGESSGASLGYGEYVKIGNICHFQWYSGTRTISSAVAGVLTGLPFTAIGPNSSSSSYPAVTFAHNTWVSNAASGYINIGTTSIYPTANNNSGANPTQTGSRYVMCSGSYRVA